MKHKTHLFGPSIFFIIFCLLQILLLAVFVHFKSSFENVTLEIARESIIPSLKYKLEHYNQQPSQNSVELAQSIPVLLYHGIVARSDGSNVTTSQFRQHMFALKNAGYSAISFSDFLLYINGKSTLPSKSVLVTFDDGRKDSYFPADPILKALNYNATMFIISGHSNYNSDSTYYLSGDDLVHMSESGRWSIQAHTQNGHDLMQIDQSGAKGHFYSNFLWLEDQGRMETVSEYTDRVTRDLKGVKRDLENQGIVVSALAFPFGDYGQESRNNEDAEKILKAIVSNEYEYAFVQERNDTNFTHNLPQAADDYLKRIEVGSSWSAENVIASLEAGEIKSFPFEDNFEKYRGWRKKIGELTFSNAAMIQKSKSGTSSLTVLDGTQKWHNYETAISVEWEKGSNVMVIPIFKSENDKVYCNFGKKLTRIEQVVDGKKTILQEIKQELTVPFSGVLATKIFSDRLSCAINGKTVISSKFDSALKNVGGFAIETWDEQKDNSSLQIIKLKADSITTGILGDVTAIEPDLAARDDVLYFGGFEGNPSWFETMKISSDRAIDNTSIRANSNSDFGKSLSTFYKKGSYASPNSPVGTSSTIFHVYFDSRGIGIGGFDELYFRYLVKFDEDFEFQKTGKLPGLAGGTSNSGGHPPNGVDGWSGRISWVKNGGLISYMYIPGIAKYGLQLPWQVNGETKLLDQGKWHCLEMHYKLNDVESSNGLLEGWIDGKLAIQRKDIVFRKANSLQIDNIMFDTFFGGDTPDFASPKDQAASFDNLVLATNYIGCPKNMY